MRCSLLLLFVCLTCCAGCRMGVPLYVWQPPKLQSAVGKTVVVSTVAGPDELASQLHGKMLALAPTDAGRDVHVVHPKSLQQQSKIQLVSATNEEPNDLALTSIGRQAGVDFLLRGEILEDRHPSAHKPQDDSPKLLVSWRLTPIGQEGGPQGSPVLVDVESAIDRYPDLAILGDPQEVLTSAAARETYRLISPAIGRERVQLAIPYMLPGSGEVRRGNALALAARWAEAEQVWQDVWERHPSQAAAVHNLALAAAAKQDFSTAKELVRKAIRLQPTGLHKKSLVWIERRQRDYHRCFNLPDPPEGWFVTTK